MSGVADVAASVVYSIGTAKQDSYIDWGEAVAAHAALGCAAGAASGQGCCGGAIGAATSAVISPLVIGALDPSEASPTLGQSSLTASIAMLAGGGIAEILDQSVTGAERAAENEALNNTLDHVRPDETGGKPGQQSEAENDAVSIIPKTTSSEQAEESGEYEVGRDLPVGVGSGIDLGMGDDWEGATNTAAEGDSTIQFGANDNQSSHTPSVTLSAVAMMQPRFKVP
ncbi:MULTISPECIES: hypothetical protein [unclassified Paraburkholderia]|uniref:hypothetical protein n=1 Tax=unclassified Paraburkholderia TaxID=2615204 RepID=UPI002AB27DED|nr:MULTISPECIES: hypothetical protein [unclassified Paraburkholderia]